MASNAKKKKHVCSNSIQQKNALLRFTLQKWALTDPFLGPLCTERKKLYPESLKL